MRRVRPRARQRQSCRARAGVVTGPRGIFSPMKITQTLSHGQIRFRVNIQRGPYRKRMFFKTLNEAEWFAYATGGKYRISAPSYPRR